MLPEFVRATSRTGSHAGHCSVLVLGALAPSCVLRAASCVFAFALSTSLVNIDPLAFFPFGQLVTAITHHIARHQPPPATATAHRTQRERREHTHSCHTTTCRPSDKNRGSPRRFLDTGLPVNGGAGVSCLTIVHITQSSKIAPIYMI